MNSYDCILPQDVASTALVILIVCCGGRLCCISVELPVTNVAGNLPVIYTCFTPKLPLTYLWRKYIFILPVTCQYHTGNLLVIKNYR